jgi:hypothetical protein
MVERVRSWLEWPIDPNEQRLTDLAGIGPAARGFSLPSASESREVLARLDVPPHAIVEILDGLPTRDGSPEAWWLLERLYHRVVSSNGVAAAPPWPAPVPGDDPLTRYFHLYVFLAAVPDVLELNGRRGIPHEVTWETLRDTGLQVANYQTRNGRPGFDGAFWIWLHFRGEIYRLGRLQYNDSRITFDGNEFGFKKGDPSLGVHIPALGPLTSDSCDESLELARGFFEKHFPEVNYRVATCDSWLLDAQLAEYLPSTSNIIRFQRRFTTVPGSTVPGDDDVVRFVFGRLPESLDELPMETTLQRAVVKHLQEGRHWQICLGWLRL